MTKLLDQVFVIESESSNDPQPSNAQRNLTNEAVIAKLRHYLPAYNGARRQSLPDVGRLSVQSQLGARNRKDYIGSTMAQFNENSMSSSSTISSASCPMMLMLEENDEELELGTEKEAKSNKQCDNFLCVEKEAKIEPLAKLVVETAFSEALAIYRQMPPEMLKKPTKTTPHLIIVPCSSTNNNNKSLDISERVKELERSNLSFECLHFKSKRELMKWVEDYLYSIMIDAFETLAIRLYHITTPNSLEDMPLLTSQPSSSFLLALNETSTSKLCDNAFNDKDISPLRSHEIVFECEPLEHSMVDGDFPCFAPTLAEFFVVEGEIPEVESEFAMPAPKMFVVDEMIPDMAQDDYKIAAALTATFDSDNRAYDAIIARHRNLPTIFAQTEVKRFPSRLHPRLITYAEIAEYTLVLVLDIYYISSFVPLLWNEAPAFEYDNYVEHLVDPALRRPSHWWLSVDKTDIDYNDDLEYLDRKCTQSSKLFKYENFDVNNNEKNISLCENDEDLLNGGQLIDHDQTEDLKLKKRTMVQFTSKVSATFILYLLTISMARHAIPESMF